MSNGGHVPSGDTVVREFAGVAKRMDVCARCTVPFRTGGTTRWGGDFRPPRRRRKG